ncbi:MAG: sulfatase [Actinomycetota bacterium]
MNPHLPPLVRTAAAIALLVSLAPSPGIAAKKDSNAARPSIVLILTDDQRADTMFAMPIVQERLAARGVSFTNAFVTNPTCCPSRASILTGQYSHSTGVYNNGGPNGGFGTFDDDSTIATRLSPKYKTGLFGKYLNGYGPAANSGFIPPGWDRWVSFHRAAYHNYSLNIDGQSRRYGNDPGDYSTAVLAGHAESFIRNTNGPLFVYFSPVAPHKPTTPAQQDAGAFAGLPPHRPPSYNEADLSDKPVWARERPLNRPQISSTDRFRKDQLRTLVAVDRAVGRIVDALAATGRLKNTLIVFTSDNGMMWGEHGQRGKGIGYEESIHVPMIVRYDPLTNASEDSHVVGNIDLAPTMADVAGIPMPGAEGRSLVPLLKGDGSGWRSALLLEHLAQKKGSPPTFCGVRAERLKLIAYDHGRNELYDLAADPFELDNLIKVPAMRDQIVSLRDRLEKLCSPPPPGTPRRFPTVKLPQRPTETASDTGNGPNPGTSPEQPAAPVKINTRLPGRVNSGGVGKIPPGVMLLRSAVKAFMKPWPSTGDSSWLSWSFGVLNSLTRSMV